MTFKQSDLTECIKTFSKLCTIIKSCKTLPQLTTARNFVLSTTKRCSLSEKMLEHLQDELTKQAQIIANKGK